LLTISKAERNRAVCAL